MIFRRGREASLASAGDAEILLLDHPPTRTRVQVRENSLAH